MNLSDIVKRTPIPEPWAGASKIPWNDPAFSERMLQEHLTQDHDMASRRFITIDAHVDWIHRHLLAEKPGRILDLGCGPGLYASRLAKLGHHCTGLDFSPASIRYAKEMAHTEGLDGTFRLADIREAEYGSDMNLVMFVFGEINTFRPQEAKQIIRKAHDALASGGTLLLEPHTFKAVQEMGQGEPSWYAVESGLFSDRPHLCLMENIWDGINSVATTRFFVIDTESGDVTQHASTTQAYTDDQYRALLTDCGFTDITFYPTLTGQVDPSQQHLFALVAHKPA
ncbi:MAG: class I SAM-dependent methyltransferase [Anaerolineae bacterium]|nr:class I SAM-dependent methyltransferase [Anaerolineae bacterium]